MHMSKRRGGLMDCAYGFKFGGEAAAEFSYGFAYGFEHVDDFLMDSVMDFGPGRIFLWIHLMDFWLKSVKISSKIAFFGRFWPQKSAEFSLAPCWRSRQHVFTKAGAFKSASDK